MSSGLTNAEVGELYRRYGYLMLRRTRSIVRNQQLAEDILQTVFLKIMRYGASVRTAESQLAWLYRTVDRCCFDILRQARNDCVGLGVEHAEEPRPVSTIEERGILGLLWRRLDPQERSVVLLLYSDGLSHQEISRRLGCSRQAIGRMAGDIRILAQRLAREMDATE